MKNTKNTKKLKVSALSEEVRSAPSQEAAQKSVLRALARAGLIGALPNLSYKKWLGEEACMLPYEVEGKSPKQVLKNVVTRIQKDIDEYGEHFRAPTCDEAREVVRITFAGYRADFLPGGCHTLRGYDPDEDGSPEDWARYRAQKAVWAEQVLAAVDTYAFPHFDQKLLLAKQ